MLTGITHVNLTVPSNTLDEAEEFYSKTLGMQRVPVPALQKVSSFFNMQFDSHTHHPRKQDRLAWYVISIRLLMTRTRRNQGSQATQV
jgi:catechol 2,3-dioxygenase-like lactoylglutathione lyase family enzyme